MTEKPSTEPTEEEEPSEPSDISVQMPDGTEINPQNAPSQLLGDQAEIKANLADESDDEDDEEST